MKFTKSSVGIALSKLKVFSEADIRSEQYPTDSEIAAEVLWNAYMNHDIKNKIIADLGCGTGILGIGALMLGAAQVFFIDEDARALDIAEQNLESVQLKDKATLIFKDIKEFSVLVDVIIMNPPFGTKEKHADRAFLEHAFKISKIVYSFHKQNTEKFLRSFSQDNKFKLTHTWQFNFPLKQTMKHHKKQIQRIDVGCFRFEKSFK